MKALVSIRGTRLYVEDYNPSNSEVLLYLHGGPAASCIDFGYQQAELLSKHMRVVMFDQRGVLRSDPIHETELFGLLEIVKDCEALRSELGIDQWTVLGHSFGGMVAFKYATLYPNSVKKVMFEAPCFDIESSMKSLIREALNIFQSIEHIEGIEACNKYLNGSYTARDLWHAWGSIIQLLGDHKDHVYFYGIDPSKYNDMVDSLVPSDDLWSRNQIHVNRLEDEGELFKSLIPELHQLSQPSLLMTGLHDPVCCEEQILAFKQNVKDHSVVIFDRSAHLPRIEEPDKYADEVLKFVVGE